MADQRGDADRTTSCVLRVPSNWATDYAWRDSGAILHSDTFRDCASNGVFSTEPTSLGTVLHETGHSPFGLADEYCCDGGYWEQAVYPNMHNTLAECQADAPRLGRAASACRRIADTRYNPVRNWYLSEPTPNDIMSFDRHPPQAADIRRIDWYFDNCEAQRR